MLEQKSSADSTPPSRSPQKLGDDPSHVTRCGDTHEGAPAHMENEAILLRVTRFARTLFAEIPPCRLAHSIQ